MAVAVVAAVVEDAGLGDLVDAPRDLAVAAAGRERSAAAIPANATISLQRYRRGMPLITSILRRRLVFWHPHSLGNRPRSITAIARRGTERSSCSFDFSSDIVVLICHRARFAFL